jgi:predicted negative regulator of RcsB-dependent stress response
MAYEHQTAVEVAAASLASRVTTAGATTSIVSWFFSNEFGFALGVVVAVGGFIVNFYYRRKENARQEQEARRREEQHVLQMAESRRRAEYAEQMRAKVQ